MSKYFITKPESTVVPFYIKNSDGSPRAFTEDEANKFLADKPYLIKVRIKG